MRRSPASPSDLRHSPPKGADRSGVGGRRSWRAIRVDWFDDLLPLSRSERVRGANGRTGRPL